MSLYGRLNAHISMPSVAIILIVYEFVSRLPRVSSQGVGYRYASRGRFAGLAFHRLSCKPSAFATGSPFHFKPDGYISKLLAPSIPLTMASRRDLLSAQRSRRASKQRDQGTLRSLVYSAAVRSDSSPESGLEVLRKNDHDEAHALKAFHGFKRAVRIESLNRDTRLSQQKRHVHIPFVYYLELT
jgi:hypothetical protein